MPNRIVDGVKQGGGNLGGDADNRQIGLSPYATWTIRIKADANPGLDLSAVREINLTFAGKYIRSCVPPGIRRPKAPWLPKSSRKCNPSRYRRTRCVPLP